MKMKLTTLLFGLLLAVGWTSNASAQLPTQSSLPAHAKQALLNRGEGVLLRDAPVKGLNSIPKVNAPRRADYDEVASAVHDKAWYDEYTYQWDGQTSKITDPATTSHQMYALIKSIYTNPAIPGIKYSAAEDKDIVYEGVDFGWDISGDVTEDIKIYMTGYVNIRSVTIQDRNGANVTSWDINATGTRPNGWTLNTNYFQRTNGYIAPRNSSNYGYNFVNDGNQLIPAITISKNLFTGKGGLQVIVNARRTRNNDAYFGYEPYTGLPGYRASWNHYTYAINYDNMGEEHILNSTNTWQTNTTIVNGPITPPVDNGYTVLLVKLKDEVDFENTQAPEYTLSQNDVYNYFDTYVDEIQLLTDGLRVGQNIDGELVDGGTLFSYSGVLNRFYFISKGKMYALSSSENMWRWTQYPASSTGLAYDLYHYSRYSDRAPFYSMYEEFSPTTQSDTEGISDFSAQMVAGNSYPIIHDCQSVCFMEHFFSMSGKTGTDDKSLTNLVFYIPDYRGEQGSRDYDPNNQPRVGLYTIHLQADAQPCATYSEENRTYTVTVDWQSNLSSIVDNQVPQTYELYEVVYDDHGNIVERRLLTTTQDVTHYTYDVPQYDASYTITYQVKGYPTQATNNSTFFAWSNFDDVVIPGLFDFMLLARDHYESDFVISQLKNYYRNYIYPTNLAPNTGMTLEQLKQEWPEDQIAKYTLYRDNTGIAQLQVRAVGKKVYYKIIYIPNTQDTSGPNDININNNSNN